MSRVRDILNLDTNESIAVLLAPLRLQLLRRMLGATLVLSMALAAFQGFAGEPLGPVLIGIAVSIAGLAGLHWGERHRSLVAWLTWLTGLAVIWYAGAHAGIDVVPVLATLPAVAAFVQGPRLGLVVLVGVIALLAQIGQGAPASEIVRFRLLVAGATAYTMLGVVLGWSWGLYRALLATADAHRSLNDTLRRRDALAQVIFGDVAQAQQRLAKRSTAEKSLHWQALETDVNALVQVTQQFRELRESLAKPVPVITDFSAPVLRALLLLFLSFSIPAAVYQLALGHTPRWAGAVMVAVCMSGLWALRRSDRAPRWAGWTWIGVAVVVLAYDMVRDRGVVVTSTLAGWGSCVLQAALLLNRRIALVLFAVGIIATIDAGVALPHAASVWPSIASHLFAQGLVVVALLQAVDGQQRVLGNLEAERTSLQAAVAQHRRYLGTLYHDIANPLGALTLLCNVGVEGEDVPGDTERARRLILRIGLLLEDSRSWLLGEPSSAGNAEEDMDVNNLVGDLQEVFSERLSQKRIRLSANVAEGTRVKCCAVALRESVLANLLSNAIKFAPPDSTVQLKAWRDDRRVHLELSDQGPGLPSELQQALHEGIDLPVHAGTGGELGQGLGLTLAKEHLKRMGGELSLRNGEEGGLIAAVTLEVA